MNTIRKSPVSTFFCLVIIPFIITFFCGTMMYKLTLTPTKYIIYVAVLAILLLASWFYKIIAVRSRAIHTFFSYINVCFLIALIGMIAQWQWFSNFIFINSKGVVTLKGFDFISQSMGVAVMIAVVIVVVLGIIKLSVPNLYKMDLDYFKK